MEEVDLSEPVKQEPKKEEKEIKPEIKQEPKQEIKEEPVKEIKKEEKPEVKIEQKEEKKALPKKEPKEVKTQKETKTEIKTETKTDVKKESVTISGTGKWRQVTFKYFDKANSVAIVSGFTSTKPRDLRKVNGVWQITLTISPGLYRYMFIVDGKEIKDPYNKQESNGRSVINIK